MESLGLALTVVIYHGTQVSNNFTDNAFATVSMSISDAEGMSHAHVCAEVIEDFRIQVRSEVRNDHVSMTK
jgi:hypothetical protein